MGTMWRSGGCEGGISLSGCACLSGRGVSLGVGPGLVRLLGGAGGCV